MPNLIKKQSELLQHEEDEVLLESDRIYPPCPTLVMNATSPSSSHSKQFIREPNMTGTILDHRQWQSSTCPSTGTKWN